jgi:hypothetical protein
MSNFYDRIHPLDDAIVVQEDLDGSTGPTLEALDRSTDLVDDMDVIAESDPTLFADGDDVHPDTSEEDYVLGPDRNTPAYVKAINLGGTSLLSQEPHLVLVNAASTHDSGRRITIYAQPTTSIAA